MCKGLGRALFPFIADIRLGVHGSSSLKLLELK